MRVLNHLFANNRAWAADMTRNDPEFFRRFLSHYLSHAKLGAAAALEATQRQVFCDANFLGTWSTLAPVDQQVLKFVPQADLAVLDPVLWRRGRSFARSSHATPRVEVLET